jgi:soluble lytic murein transglycosylase
MPTFLWDEFRGAGVFGQVATLALISNNIIKLRSVLALSSLRFFVGQGLAVAFAILPQSALSDQIVQVSLSAPPVISANQPVPLVLDQAVAPEVDSEKIAAELASDAVSLELFRFPSETEVKRILGIDDRQTYEQSVEILVAWINGKRSLIQQAESACAQFIPENAADFKMSAFSLRCVPFMLEQRAFRKDEKKGGATLSADASGAQSTAAGGRASLKGLADWQRLGSIGYRDFLRRFRPADKRALITHVAYAVDPSVTCESSVALAAMVGRVEEFLPDPEAWAAMRSVYDKYAKCEVASDVYRETVHLRMGLTAIYFGQIELARTSLERALLAPVQEDRQRTLFWLGLLDRTETQEREIIPHFQNKHWAALGQESPLSIHAVIVAHVLGRDPYSGLIGEVQQNVRRRDGSQWSNYNLIALVSEVLMARDDAASLKSWSMRLARDWKETDPEKQLFIGIVHNKAHNFLQSIQVLTSYLKGTTGRKHRVEFLKLLFPTPFSDSILESSEDLDPLLVFGLIRQESAFNPLARSIADARGLMQLLPGTASLLLKVTPIELYQPEKNVLIGTRYLRKLLERNNNHLERVLAAYNAGQRHIERWAKRFPGANDLLFADLIPFKETRSNVSLIQRNTYWYGRLWAEQKANYAPELIARMERSNFRSRTVNVLLRSARDRVQGPRSETNVQFLESFDVSSLLPPIDDLGHFATQ